MGKIKTILKMYMTEESKTDAFIVLMILWTLFSLGIIADSSFGDKEEIIRTYVSDPIFHEHKNVEVVKSDGLSWRDVNDSSRDGRILSCSNGYSDSGLSDGNYICEASEEVASFHTLIGTEDTEEQITEEIRDGEIEMLAQLIQAEAGNQDYRGMCLVADVVLNRVASDIFPNSVEEVIAQYLTDKHGGKHYQFSTFIDGSLEKAGWYISDNARKAAYQEYMAERRIDDNILSFTAGSYNPFFTPAYKYGDHYFGY